jgi:glycogen operon protein
VTGSSDIYALSGRRPWASVNFVTAHDGFTLRDLVTYERKHNDANGEQNRDGTDDNRSQNFGVEGESTSPVVRARRRAGARAMLATLLLSIGTPMIVGGDERWRTQGGNNNAYCLDDETTWVDWSPDTVDPGAAEAMTAFTARLTAIRRSSPDLHRDVFLSDSDVRWWNPGGRTMSPGDWHDGNARALGLLTGDWLFLLNGDGSAQPCVLPGSTPLHPVLDTSREDGCPASPRLLRAGSTITLPPHSLLLLSRRSAP